MYKKLAKQGRFGDTEISKTSKGSLWHVTKEEKKLIDDYGVLGERIVDIVGSGTINPKTGLEEKNPLLALAAASFLTGSAQSYGQTKSAREQGRMQMGFLDDALSSLNTAQKSLSDSLSGSLSLPSLEAEREKQDISKQGSRTLEKVREKQENISSSTGFASISMDNDMNKEAREMYQKKIEDVDISLSKNLSEVLSGYEQQKFEMESQRQQLEQQKKLAKQQSNTKYFGVF
tara:strand:- start:2474 stop:3169 length:696 start_codon:yes stop_codon:yes gene_type:complete